MSEYEQLVAALNAELEQWVGDDNTMILRNALRKIIRESQEAQRLDENDPQS